MSVSRGLGPSTSRPKLAQLGTGLVGLVFATATLAQTPAVQPAAPQPAPAASAAQAQAAPAAGATVQAVPDTVPASVTTLDDPDSPTKPGDATTGQGKAAVCVACHGIDGNSIDPQYPKIAGMAERYTARQLALYKSGERENAVMLAFAAVLSPQDMRDIGAWYAKQKALPGVADDTVITAGPNEGKKFYQVGEQLWRAGAPGRSIPACLACHGPAGAGNPGPAYPALSGQHAGYVATQLTAFREGRAWGKGKRLNNVMVAVAAQLTDEEIQALATYAEGLHPVADEAVAGAVPSAAPVAAPPQLSAPQHTAPAEPAGDGG